MFCGVRWVYAESGWSRIAALAPAVVACAQDGDPVAHQILQEGAADLVTTVQAVVKQLNMCQPFKLVLAGVMQHAPASCSLRSFCCCLYSVIRNSPGSVLRGADDSVRYVSSSPAVVHATASNMQLCLCLPLMWRVWYILIATDSLLHGCTVATYCARDTDCHMYGVTASAPDFILVLIQED